MKRHDADQWQTLALEIERTVDRAWAQYKEMPDEALAHRPYADAWSAKEIIGHLIDSAANNHQRFVRLQVSDRTDMPDYSRHNHEWVSVQRYQETPWVALLEFWRHYNHHLARIVRWVDARCLEHLWQMDEETAFRLDALMEDYLRHLTEHLQQIEERLQAGG